MANILVLGNLPSIVDGAVQLNLQDESQRRTFTKQNPKDGENDSALSFDMEKIKSQSGPAE